MSAHAMRLVGGAFTFGWVALLGLLLSLVVATHLAPALGRSLFVIHGGSMEPAFPLGALLVDRQVDPASVAVGDVVTFQTASGVDVTHRITRIVGSGDSLRFETRGDANASPDPVLIQASEVIGRAEFAVPLAGYFMAMTATPTGLLAILSMIGAFLAAGWLLDELRAAPAPERRPVRSDELQSA